MAAGSVTPAKARQVPVREGENDAARGAGVGHSAGAQAIAERDERVLGVPAYHCVLASAAGEAGDMLSEDNAIIAETGPDRVITSARPK